MKSPHIVTLEYGDVSNLRCPRCGSQYLHHGIVRVYDRAEDAETTIVTTVNSGCVASHRHASKEVPNPSSRRDGVTIDFWCERCSGELCDCDLTLTIAQHKGNTEIGWLSDNPPESKDEYLPGFTNQGRPR